MKTCLLHIFAAFLLLFASCEGSRDTAFLLEEAGELLKVSGDSALILLKEIEHPEKLQGTDKARYCYLYTVALLNEGYGVSSDSLVNIARTYYVSVGDSAHIQKSAYWQGVVQLNLGELDSARVLFREAIRYGTGFDKKLQALCYLRMGNTYYWQSRYNEALDVYGEGKKYASSFLSDRKLDISFLRDIGRAYAKQREWEKSLTCYRQILDLVSVAPDNLPVSMFLHEVSDIYLRKGDFKQALYYANQAKDKRENRHSVPMHNLILGKIHMHANQMDSARSYLLKALQNTDYHVSVAAYESLMELDMRLGNYENAYSLFQKKEEAFSYLLDDEIGSPVMRQKYQEEKLKNENNLLKLDKKERELYLLWLSLFVLFAFTMIYIFFSRERRKRSERERMRQELLLKEEAKFLENENRLLRVEGELSILREKESSLRESLFRRMTMAGKIPSLDNSPKMEGELVNSSKRIVLTDQDWEELIQTVNDAYDGFAVRLQKEYPELTRKDIVFCCLLKIKVTMKDLSDIYCITKAGITKKKTRMKKEKFNLPDDSSTLDTFLQEF